VADPPNVFTIPAGAPFVDALAAGILEREGDDPARLCRAVVFLPTRRACRALRDAFLRAGGGRALLLPAIKPLGDVDEDGMGAPEAFAAASTDGDADLPPAIAPMRRLLLLARLVQQRAAAAGGADDALASALGGDPATALLLAEALAALLDSVALEDLSLDALDKLVPEALAEHWQKTLDFLVILREHWPRILAEEGRIDGAARRVAALRSLAAAWKRQPPSASVYAAGSTGSIPAAAELMVVIARLPRGAVILPGLDQRSDAEAWSEILNSPTHPQYGLGVLLNRLQVDRREVRPWPAAGPGNAARAHLLAEALAPAGATDHWQGLTRFPDAAFAGLTRVDCPGPQEEAGAIALCLREALETPGRTAALVTPDRQLARRVASELKRWNIGVDDSAGMPLDQTPPGAFLRLVAQALIEDLAPVPLLAMAKHPLCHGGMARRAWLKLARRLERRALRGPRPAPGFAGIRAALVGRDDELLAWLGRLERAVQPLASLLAGPAISLPELLAAHVRVTEELATGDDGHCRLWTGDAGDALHAFTGELLDSAPVHFTLAGRHWPALLARLMAGRAVRPRFGLQPRLFIWGLLEARLQSADRLVLGGLNEGAWPPEIEEDPWLSRPMRRAFGLPPQERRIGQVAHDFAQCAAASEAVFTRARKVAGVPTVPARWLLRLDAMLAADERWSRDGRAPYLHWQRELDRPAQVEPAPPPAPMPPVASRPRRLSVTEIETWIRDPYAIFARHVLALRPLDPLDEDPSAMDLGTAVHQALDRFIAAFPHALPDDALARLLAIGRDSFAALPERPAIGAFWWPRFERMAHWFVHEFEPDRRAAGYAALATEIRGVLRLPGPHGEFELVAKADRIDRMNDGALAILDYKTGALPSAKAVEMGLAPQLPLEAAMALAGGFAGIAAAKVGELGFVQLTGRDPPGDVKLLTKVNAAELGRMAREGLERLIAVYDRPSTAYRSRPRPLAVARPGDYDHLARVKEWGAASAAEE
jgi:ATP-dependent helicase/nuclease subunit B